MIELPCVNSIYYPFNSQLRRSRTHMKHLLFVLGFDIGAVLLKVAERGPLILFSKVVDVLGAELQLRPVPRLSAKDAVPGLHLPMRIPVNTL